MVKVDAIEGVVDGVLSCHSYSEETEDGLLMVRRQDDDVVAGMTIVNWWKRFGNGALTDSIHELEQVINPWALRLAA